MAWFTNPQITKQLPATFRCYAAYARAVGDPRSGAVRGGTALQRALARVIRRFNLADVAVVDVDGLRLAVDLLDLRLPEVFAEMTAPARELDILRASLRPGGTFLDIGANHGAYAVHLARAVGTAGQVLAFEPQPRLAVLIRRSFDENQIPGGEVIEGACGDVDRDVVLHVPALSGMASLFRESVTAAVVSTITVHQYRLDNVMTGRPIGDTVAVKLDAEGAEVGVINGGREFFRAHRPPMVIELNHDSLRAAGETPASLVDALQGGGYTTFSELATWPASRPLAELDIDPQRNVVVEGKPFGT